MKAVDCSKLDKGIRDYVLVLHAAGIYVTESGDGTKASHVYPHPYMVLRANAGLYDLLDGLDLEDDPQKKNRPLWLVRNAVHIAQEALAVLGEGWKAEMSHTLGENYATILLTSISYKADSCLKG